MLSKKVPTNKKYANISSVISHGKTTADVSVISDNLLAKKKGEHFCRIKCSTLAKYLKEVDSEESVFGLVQSA